jgi:hypothetical protein
MVIRLCCTSKELNRLTPTDGPPKDVAVEVAVAVVGVLVAVAVKEAVKEDAATDETPYIVSSVSLPVTAEHMAN